MRLIVAVSVLLAGCASINAERQQERLNSAHSACQSVGFKPGQEGYGNCVMTLYNQSEASDAQRRAAAMAFGLQMLSTPPPAPMPSTTVIVQPPPVYYPPTVLYPKK